MCNRCQEVRESISDISEVRLSEMCRDDRAKFKAAYGNAICELCGGWNECNCPPRIEPQAQVILDQFHVMAVTLSASDCQISRVIGEQMHETIFGILDEIEDLS